MADMKHCSPRNDRLREVNGDNNADNSDHSDSSGGEISPTEQGPAQQEGEDPKGPRSSSRAVPNLPTPDLPSSPFSAQHPPSLRSASNTPSMTASSTPLGNINAARRPGPRTATTTGSTDLAEGIQAKMKAFSLSRQGAPTPSSSSSSVNSGAPAPPPLAGGMNSNALPNGPAVAGRVPPVSRLPTQMRPVPPNWSPTHSPSGAGQATPPVAAPNVGGGGLAAKRGVKSGMKLSHAVTPPQSGSEDQKRNGPAADPSSGPAAGKQEANHPPDPNAFNRYSDMIDTKAGTLNFKNKAVIHGGGIEFITGRSFKISLDDVDMLEELGKGNYGSVYKVRHCKPQIRRPGLNLSGFVSPRQQQQQHYYHQQHQQHPENLPPSEGKGELSNVVMALKEIRLELDDAQFTAIIMELDILHRCVSPFVIDFYGAFFQEGAVYICVEYMDGGSVEKLYDGGIPEHILRKIALSTAMGLKSLKDEHNIIHRDVKPTNILLNTRGQIKICDFGVSGNLVASIAKTNVGCQSYMAPERISGGSAGPNPGSGAYGVQSDVWSLGLSLVECASGGYPYPPEAYTNIFSQLNAIVKGDPPRLPDEGYSDEAKDFVHSCLNKKASLRPSYSQLIRHPWLASLMEPPTSKDGDPSPTAEEKASADQEHGVEPPPANYPDTPPTDLFDHEVSEWVRWQLDRKLSNRSDKTRPALHAVALDAVAGDGPLLDTSSGP